MYALECNWPLLRMNATECNSLDNCFIHYCCKTAKARIWVDKKLGQGQANKVNLTLIRSRSAEVICLVIRFASLGPYSFLLTNVCGSSPFAPSWQHGGGTMLSQAIGRLFFVTLPWSPPVDMGGMIMWLKIGAQPVLWALSFHCTASSGVKAVQVPLLERLVVPWMMPIASLSRAAFYNGRGSTAAGN